jgi:hypothetical protein
MQCPICLGDNTRSKVCDANQDWWYVCDNQTHLVNMGGAEVDLNKRTDPDTGELWMRAFYFSEGRIEIPDISGLTSCQQP